MDMEGAKKAASTDEGPNSRNKRRISFARRTAVQGRGSIGSVSAGIYKAFRERFLSSDDSGDYRKLRQRDAEAGQVWSDHFQSSGSSGVEREQEPSSSSSVEDLFTSETEHRQWRRQSAEQRRRGAGRKKTRPGIDNSSSEDEDESVVRHTLTPGSIGPQTDAASASSANAKTKKKKKPNPLATPLVEEQKKQPDTLEEWQEQQEREDTDILETRKCPEYTMTYSQAVGTEDVFLQMGNRTGSSASCENLILDIHLPDEETTADKMKLTLQERDLDLATVLYRLRMPLPHPVEVDRCQAKYSTELRMLRLTLRLRRELDYVNF